MAAWMIAIGAVVSQMRRSSEVRTKNLYFCHVPLHACFQAAYSLYENKDNGQVMSKEEQQKWNAKKEPETTMEK